MNEFDDYQRYSVEDGSRPEGFDRPYRLTPADEFALCALKQSDTELAANGLRRTSVGQLVVNSGALAVFDPLWSLAEWSNRLDRYVPNGRYPASLLSCKAGSWGERNAMLVVEFKDQPIDQWVPASFGQPSAYSVDQKSHLIGVDAGTVGLADAESLKKLETVIKNRIEAGEIDDEYDHIEEMNEQYDLVAQNYEVGAGPENLIMIGTGIGDGSYPVYWGLDANQEPVSLAVSFYLLEARFRHRDGG